MALRLKEEIEKYSYENPIMIYDGVCNFCNGAVQFILRHETNKSIRFLAFQSDAGREILRSLGRSTEGIDSVILIEKGKYFFESDVSILTIPLLKPRFMLFSWIKWIPKRIRNYFYKLIANNRYRLMGKSDTCQIPPRDERYRFLHL